MIKQCPVNPDYRFKTKCTIKNCRMYTERTKNHCMEIDTLFVGDKNISDKELVFYKRPGMDLKDMTSLRKKAVNRVYAIIAMRAAIQYIEENKKEVVLNVELMPANIKNVFNKVLASKIFKVAELNLKPWMLAMLLDKNYAEEFPTNLHSFQLHLLFLITPTELKNLTEYFTRLGTSRNQRGLFNV